MGFQSMNFELIDTMSKFEDIVPILSSQKLLGIDIESNSMYRYNQSISLCQIAFDDHVYLIDSTKIGIPIQLQEILLSDSILKVFQDMQYDLAMFKYEYCIEVANVYDISIADRLLRNSPENRSMDKLISKYLGKKIRLSSSLQKSNWENRPLSQKQIKYAVQDTKYILPVYNEINALLQSNYLGNCFDEYMKNYEISDIRRKYNIYSMWKIKGVNSLDLNSQLTLRGLLIERNKLAMEINRPLHWLIRERLLMRILREKPTTKKEFAKLAITDQPKYLRQKIINRLFEAYENSINRTTSDDHDLQDLKPPHGHSLRKWLPISPPPFFDAVDTTRLSLIKDWLKKVSRSSKLLPEFILSKEQRTYLSTDRKNIFSFSEFPGLISQFKEPFRNDLIEYLVTEKSLLTSTRLNQIFNHS